MRGDGKGDVGERSKPKSAHARFCSINGTIVGRWGGDNFSKVSGTRRDVLGQPEEFLELMVNLLGRFGRLHVEKKMITEILNIMSVGKVVIVILGLEIVI